MDIHVVYSDKCYAIRVDVDSSCRIGILQSHYLHRPIKCRFGSSCRFQFKVLDTTFLKRSIWTCTF
jgi:hypothetical protein